MGNIAATDLFTGSKVLESLAKAGEAGDPVDPSELDKALHQFSADLKVVMKSIDRISPNKDSVQWRDLRCGWDRVGTRRRRLHRAASPTQPP